MNFPFIFRLQKLNFFIPESRFIKKVQCALHEREEQNFFIMFKNCRMTFLMLHCTNNNKLLCKFINFAVFVTIQHFNYIFFLFLNSQFWIPNVEHTMANGEDTRSSEEKSEIMKISTSSAISDKVKQLIISNLHSNQKAQHYDGAGCWCEFGRSV